MSTQIYDAYKFVGNGKDKPTLDDVYKFLTGIKKTIVDFYSHEAAKQEVIDLHKVYYKAKLYRDADYTKTEFFQKYATLGYENVNENCVVIAHKGELYIKFFIGFNFRDLKAKISRSKKLQDFHYQNSSDGPSDMTKKEWNERKKTWDRILGDNTTFGQCGFVFKFYTFEDFDFKLYLNACDRADAARKQQQEQQQQ